ncbi:MAG: NAD(P)H-dependent oxidoreductase [Pseudomonadota bacterium]
MSRVLVYYAHPGERFSKVNTALYSVARDVDGIQTLDLYRAYPRFNIDIDAEQQRLRDHDVIVFQHPLFWYSTPSLVKEWQDLVLEHGFAYGTGGDALQGKYLMQALSAAGPEDAYSTSGYQHFELRQFLTPMEQTARLCGMHYLAPYAMYGALYAVEEDRLEPHLQGYQRLLEALRDDRLDLLAAQNADVLNPDTLPLKPQV